MRQIDRLTDLKIKALTDPGKYPDGRNLYLQVSEWRTKAWLFRYMKYGSEHWMGLGPYPEVTLSKARKRRDELREELRRGNDPLGEKRIKADAARVETAKALSFEDAAERYIKAHKAGWKNAKHADQWKATLSTYAYPVFGKLPVAAIDTGLVMKVIEPIWTTKTETASRVRGRIEKILGWAKARGFRTGENPARWNDHLDKLLPAKTKTTKVKHQPAMSYGELPEFMKALRSANSISARGLEFLILTATRTGEVINADWSEIDFDGRVWSIPAARTKSGRIQRVPLSDRAIEILRCLPREKGGHFLFPGARANRPLSNMALLEFLRGAKGNHLTVHGFRSTFRDWCAERTNYPREIAEAALGHVLKDKTEAAYQRGDLLEKRRKLMSAWDAYCAKPASNGEVVSLHRGA